ncbi:MAG: RluA family pseudouridine synthase [Christensenellaceae bacterium]
MDKRFFIAEESCKRLDVFLSEQMEDFTRSRVKKLIDGGRVAVNGCPAKASAEIKAGDEVAAEIPDAEAYAVKPEPIPVDIVYQDIDLAVVIKPQGMTVHIGNGNTEGTLVNASLCAGFVERDRRGIAAGIVHRIDKDTSGLLVVAKTTRAASLAKQIAEKSCHRIYLALLEGNVKTDSGRIVTDIGRSPSDRLKMAVLPEGKGKTAVTDYETLTHYGSDYTLCRFTLQTGRTHQIRVHAKYMGHPVVGDPLYGIRRQRFSLAGQLLHAYKLIFMHPSTGERMEFTAPLPDYFQSLLEKLGRQYGVEL